MAADKKYMEYIMDLLAPIEGVRNRAMFGGYGIFHEEVMFALISNSRLYFKVNDSNRPQYEQENCEQFMTMPYYEVPASVLDDEAGLQSRARESIAIAHATASVKKRKRKSQP